MNLLIETVIMRLSRELPVEGLFLRDLSKSTYPISCFLTLYKWKKRDIPLLRG